MHKPYNKEGQIHRELHFVEVKNGNFPWNVFFSLLKNNGKRKTFQTALKLNRIILSEIFSLSPISTCVWAPLDANEKKGEKSAVHIWMRDVGSSLQKQLQMSDEINVRYSVMHLIPIFFLLLRSWPFKMLRLSEWEATIESFKQQQQQQN